MSSPSDVKLCRGLDEMRKDEAKARDSDYLKLIKLAGASKLPSYAKEGLIGILTENREDEAKHFFNINTAFNAICAPRLRLLGSKKESFDPSAYGAVITSEGIYPTTRRRRKSRRL